MSSWPHIVKALQEKAEQRGGTAYVGRHGESLTLATPGAGSPITVEDMGDDGARIRTDWIVDILADGDEHSDRPPQVIHYVEAIMTGGAEETVYCDEPTGRWVGTLVTINHDEGAAHSGVQQSAGSRAFSRRLPAWS